MGTMDQQSKDFGLTITPTPKAAWLADIVFRPNHARNIYVKAQETDGRSRAGVRCFVVWPDGKEVVVTDTSGESNFPMGWDCPISRDPTTGKWGGGPYRAYIGEPPESEVVWGMGVPSGEANADFILTFKAVQARPRVEDRAIAVARQQHLMPINTGAALYKKAHDELKWGDAQTDEFPFTFENEAYIGQVFNLGLVYAKKSNVNDVFSVKKPWPGA